MEEDTRKKIALVRYFWEQGYQVIPLNPGKKQPLFKGWPHWRTSDPTRLDTAVKMGWGFGLKPNQSDFAFIDVDNDHKAGEDGSGQLEKIMPEISTVSQTKVGGTNRHYFFKLSEPHSWRFTGEQEIATGVEVASRDAQVRIFPGYTFDNLDLSRSFDEQLEAIPENISYVLDAMVPTPKPHFAHGKYHKGYAEKYLKKVPIPQPGERQSKYRYLTYHMTVKLGMPYDDVVKALTQWDATGANFQTADPAGFTHALRMPH